MEASQFRNVEKQTSSILSVGGHCSSNPCWKVKLFFTCSERTVPASAGPVLKHCSVLQRWVTSLGSLKGKSQHRATVHETCFHGVLWWRLTSHPCLPVRPYCRPPSCPPPPFLTVHAHHRCSMLCTSPLRGSTPAFQRVLVAWMVFSRCSLCFP